jgi:putative ABC transport system permease protein
MDTLTRDLRHAMRGLVRRPAYAIVVITTLALVIGAATAIFAVVNATLVRPLPFPHSDRLVQLFLMPPGQTDWTSRNPQSAGTFLRFRQNLKQTELVEGLWSRERVLGGGTEPDVVIAGAVSPGLFSLFGGTAIHGRTFTEEEDRANAKVVVLGHAIWQRQFGADPSVVGRTVLIDRDGHEVIGVMPPAFATGFTPTDLWTPLNATEAQVASGNTVVQTFARLRAGVSVEQLQAELGPIMKIAVSDNPQSFTGWSAVSVGLRDGQFRLQRTNLLALAGGVIALLLIACANLANLTLAQVMAKRSQLALRVVLGGSRAALVRLQLIETLLLATAGTAAGLWIGRLVLPALLALDPALRRTFGVVGIDWRVQLTVALAATMVALASGLAPILRELRADPSRSMAEGTRRVTGSRRDRRMRTLLVGAECALSVALLGCAAILFSGFDRVSRVDPGFDPRSVLAAQVRISATAYPTEAARADLIGRVLEQVRGVPGVASAGATLNRFIPGFFFVTRIHVEDKPTPDGQPYVVHFRRASTDYFKTMEIPLLSGRDFADSDRLGQPLVAIVSRQFAAEYWPGGQAVGRRIRRSTNPNWITVIGVVGDVRDVAVSQPSASTVYLPFSQNNVALTPVSLVVRTRAEPHDLANAIRAAVLSVDSQQPIDSVTTVEQFLSDSLGPQRLRSALLLVLGALGLALAALGVYGITSRAVVERTSELGVRLALGASPGSLAGLVVWQSLRAVLAGLVIGLALVGAAAAVMLSLLPNLERGDAWATAPAVLILVFVAVAAAVVPARRATSLAPVVALRNS